MRGEMGELAGKTCLVTGSSSGIGAATATIMAQHGADVVVNYRTSQEAGKKIADRIQQMGQKSLLIRTDVTK